MKYVIVLVLLASSASAQPQGDRAKAEVLFRAGAKAYAAQSFEAAAESFDGAYKLLPMPEIAFSAAQAYRRLYRVSPKPFYVRRAVELYRGYLDKVKTGGRVGDAADNLAEMEKELDKLKASGTSTAIAQVEHTRLGVSVTIAGESSTELGALREIGDGPGTELKGLKATLDGQPIEPFALADVDAKEHVLAVSADGYFPAEKKAVAVKGQSQLIELELRPKPAKVTVKTEDDAHIAVDGRGAQSPLELAAGKHLLTITHRGREPYSREIVVTRGDDLTVSAPLAKTGRRRAVPWVLTGAVLLAAGAGTTGVFAVIHDGRAADYKAQIAMGNRPPSDGDRFDEEVRSRDRFVNATWVLGGAAVVAGAVAAGLYFFDSPQPTERGVVPSVTSSGASLTVVGRF